MGTKLKYFTLKEAEKLIPTLQAGFEKIQEIRLKIEEKVEYWRKVHKKMTDVDETLFRSQVDFLVTQLDSELGKIADLGCVPKDLESGLVDFPARIDGKEGYFCWKIGETTIAYWHNLTEGFSGRRLIS
ncbi:MAG: DUF2203 domain-containing protein [Elusimicrobiota bacterium]